MSGDNAGDKATVKCLLQEPLRGGGWLLPGAAGRISVACRLQIAQPLASFPPMSCECNVPAIARKTTLPCSDIAADIARGSGSGSGSGGAGAGAVELHDQRSPACTDDSRRPTGSGKAGDEKCR